MSLELLQPDTALILSHFKKSKSAFRYWASTVLCSHSQVTNTHLSHSDALTTSKKQRENLLVSISIFVAFSELDVPCLE